MYVCVCYIRNRRRCWSASESFFGPVRRRLSTFITSCNPEIRRRRQLLHTYCAIKGDTSPPPPLRPHNAPLFRAQDSKDVEIFCSLSTPYTIFPLRTDVTRQGNGLLNGAWPKKIRRFFSPKSSYIREAEKPYVHKQKPTVVTNLTFLQFFWNYFRFILTLNLIFFLNI